MPVYTYQAKDSAGQTVSGTVSAPDERLAAGQVRELGYYPMRVERGGAASDILTAAPRVAAAGTGVGSSTRPPASISNTGFDPGFAPSRFAPSEPYARRARLFDSEDEDLKRVTPYGSWFARMFVYPVYTGVSPRDLALYYRQMSAMLGAGMTIVRALDTMAAQSGGMLRRASRVMSEYVQAGGRLSEAMAIFPFVFKRLQRSMVQSAEQTGNIDAIMVRISEYLESEDALRRMVKKETFMPKINFAATFLLPTAVVWVMHGAHAYFTEAVLPLLKILGAFLMVYVVGRIAFNIMPIAITYDAIKAYIPYFGGTVRMLALAKFSRALASLYASGVLIPRAIETAGRTTGNEFLRYAMGKASDNLMNGMPLAQAFAATHMFPKMFVAMLQTGEETGNLDELLNKIAEFYEAEAGLRLHQSVIALNVLIFLVVAVIVAREVIGFYTGYFNGVMNAGGDGS